MQPCDHTNIPHYQNLDFTKDTYRSCKPSIDTINERLAKLTPRGKMIAKTVAIIALSAIPLLAGIIAGSLSATATGILIFPMCSGVVLSEYFGNRGEARELQERIADIYSKYGQEFTFLSKKHKKVMSISAEDYERIKTYTSETNPLTYQVRKDVHYKIGGGIIENWSITPLELKKVCKTTNADKIIEHYRPWINFLINITKDENLPEAFLQLIGKMAGFKRTLFDVAFYEGDTYAAIYKNQSIICTRKSDRAQIVIKTPEECTDFVLQAFAT